MVDAELSRRIDKARSRRMWWAWVACLVSVVVGVASSSVADESYVRGDTAQQVARVIVLLIALGFMIVYLVVAVRRGYFHARRRSPLWLLPRAEVTPLMKAVRRNEMPPGVPWNRVRAAAESMQRGRLQVLANVGLGLMLAVQASWWRPPVGWAFAALAAVSAAGSVLVVRDARAADLFLVTHEGADAFDEDAGDG